MAQQEAIHLYLAVASILPHMAVGVVQVVAQLVGQAKRVLVAEGVVQEVQEAMLLQALVELEAILQFKALPKATVQAVAEELERQLLKTQVGTLSTEAEAAEPGVVLPLFLEVLGAVLFIVLAEGVLEVMAVGAPQMVVLAVLGEIILPEAEELVGTLQMVLLEHLVIMAAEMVAVGVR